MSQNDAEKIGGSEEQEQRSDKLVDVSEAIRYRKRAQNAEQKQAALEQELGPAKAEVEKLNKNLSDMTIERRLVEKLVACGVQDVEAAVIIGKARLKDGKESDVTDVVSQLRKEKGYLFSDNAFSSAAGVKTSGVKNKLSGATGALERTAKKACQTGSRADLQEYLRARRNFVK